MKQYSGFKKSTIGDTSVLLAGGGSKELSNFIGSLNWDSTNRKLQYKSASATDWSDLVTFGARALDNTTYLPLSGGILTNSNSVLTIKSNTSDSWIYFYSKINDTDTARASVGYYSNLAFIANEKTYARMGIKDDGTPVYWDRSSNTNEKVLLHSGNYTSYKHEYTNLTGSTAGNADQAIVSNGTANGWILKTLGSNAFSSDSYVTTNTNQTITGRKTFYNTAIFNGRNQYLPSGGWCEGIRVNVAENGWSSLVMGGEFDSVSGHDENTWCLATYDGTFYFAKDGSSSYTHGFTWTKAGALNFKVASFKVNNTNVSLEGHTHSEYIPKVNFSSVNVGNCAWGMTTTTNGYSTAAQWSTPAPSNATSNPGGIVFAYKDTQAYIQIDGFFYQNEGQYKVIDSNSILDYYWANVKISDQSNDTTTPTFGNTTINGTVNVNSKIYYRNASGENGWRFGGNTTSNDYVGRYSTYMTMWNATAALTNSKNNEFVLYDNGDAQIRTGYYLTSSGNSGFGTTSPSHRIHASGNIYASQTFISGALQSSIDYAVVPAQSAIAFQVGAGGTTGSNVWLWRLNWTSSNYGLFFDDTNDYLYWVGGSVAQMMLDTNGGILTIKKNIKFTDTLSQNTSPTCVATWSSNNSANGFTYTNVSNLGAGLIVPNSNANSYSVSTWNPLSYTKIWGEAFTMSGNSDNGAILFYLRNNERDNSGGKELCLCIDGDFYSQTSKVLHTGNCSFWGSTPSSAGVVNGSIDMPFNTHIRIGTQNNNTNSCTGYISAGSGYSTGAGRYGVKILACDQTDCQSGLGQDLAMVSGWSNAYNFSIAGCNSSTDYGYISFVTHKVNSTTYRWIGGFYDNAGTVQFKVAGNSYSTNFYTTSDRSKKKNINSFSEHISKFTLKDTNKDAYGVIAQDIPEMFRDGKEGEMTVNYNSILSYYIGCLENKVKELEEKINKLENK